MLTRQAQTAVTTALVPRARAPGTLLLVQDFVNTRDMEEGTDELARPDSLRGWLAGRGLLPVDAAVGTADVARAAALREALRTLLFAHHGEPADAGAIGAVNRAANEARLAPRFADAGGYRLEPGAPGVGGALGWIVTAVSEAMDAGTWERLKACRNDACQWAFYDSSRNHSGSWCRMAVCGNRMKVRAYRRRRREGGQRRPEPARPVRGPGSSA